jgi:hypothetical protein
MDSLSSDSRRLIASFLLETPPFPEATITFKGQSFTSEIESEGEFISPLKVKEWMKYCSIRDERDLFNKVILAIADAYNKVTKVTTRQLRFMFQDIPFNSPMFLRLERSLITALTFETTEGEYEFGAPRSVDKTSKTSDVKFLAFVGQHDRQVEDIDIELLTGFLHQTLDKKARDHIMLYDPNTFQPLEKMLKSHFLSDGRLSWVLSDCDEF